MNTATTVHAKSPVLSLGGLLKALGMSGGSAGGGDGDRLLSFAQGKAINPFINNELMNRMKSPIRSEIAKVDNPIFSRQTHINKPFARKSQ